MLIWKYISLWKLKTTHRNTHTNIPEKTHIFAI